MNQQLERLGNTATVVMKRIINGIGMCEQNVIIRVWASVIYVSLVGVKIHRLGQAVICDSERQHIIETGLP